MAEQEGDLCGVCFIGNLDLQNGMLICDRCGAASQVRAGAGLNRRRRQPPPLPPAAATRRQPANHHLNLAALPAALCRGGTGVPDRHHRFEGVQVRAPACRRTRCLPALPLPPPGQPPPPEPTLCCLLQAVGEHALQDRGQAGQGARGAARGRRRAGACRSGAAPAAGATTAPAAVHHGALLV